MTAVTSPTLPATSVRFSPSGWLRVALVAAIAGVALELPAQLALGEPAIDRAVGLELAAAEAQASPELFSRAEQRAGLVAGDLLLAAGFAFILAGLAVLLQRTALAPERRWLLLGTGAAWAVTIVPAALLPPLPPGVESELGMTERQALYVAAIGLGALSFVAAARAVRAAPPRARVLVVLGLASALAVGAACFPDQLARGAVPEGTLMQFRFGSLVGQLFFWIGLTTAGCLLLRQRRSATTA